MNVGNILTKGLGIATLGIVAYDAHNLGKYESSAYQRESKSAMMKDSFYNTMTHDTPSAVQNGIKKKYFAVTADESYSGFFTNMAGYVKGVFNGLISSVIPLTLATGAVLIKNKNTATKFLSRGCAVGLAACGTIFVLNDVLGIGKKH